MQELLDDHGVTSFSMRKLWLQGRKMAAHMLWKEHEKEPKARDKFETSKISGASRSDGKFVFDGRGDLCVKRKFDDKSSHKLNNAAGFVAFNSDYHGPKHHPPKHN